MGFKLEEACLRIQDPGFSEETSEDPKEGKKLPEKTKGEVDRVVVEVIRILIH